MTENIVLLDKADGVGLIVLNRPAKKNAMNPQQHEDMTRLLDELRYDHDVRCLVIAGAGDAFCAGMDLKVGWKDSGVGEFVQGKFKPGLEGHEPIKT